MSAVSVLSELLQRLPANARRTLYAVVSAAGAVLALLQTLGWDLGPISLDRALQVYALVAPAVGVVAVANVSTPGLEDFGADLDADFDPSSFHAADDLFRG